MPARPATLDPIIATQLRVVKEHFKLSQNEFAELCGLSQGMISLMMNGKREIPGWVLKNLFLKKSISPVFMFTGEGSMEYRKKSSGTEITIKGLLFEIELMKGQIAKLMAAHADKLKETSLQSSKDSDSNQHKKP